MEKPTIPQNATEWAAKKINEDRAGGTITVPFPHWAHPVFVSTLNAANHLSWSPSQVALFALTQWLEGNGHLVYSPPPPEKKPALPDGVEGQIREAIRWTVTEADATRKIDKNESLHQVLDILRAIQGGEENETQEGNE